MYLCSGGSRISRRKGRQPRKGAPRPDTAMLYVKTKDLGPLGGALGSATALVFFIIADFSQLCGRSAEVNFGL